MSCLCCERRKKRRGREGAGLTADDDVVNVLWFSPLGEVEENTPLVVDVEIAALWTAEQTRVVLDGISFCWRVDYTEHFLQVVLKQLFRCQLGVSEFQSAGRYEPYMRSSV
jgi:hypothetical protein